jgi:predicted PurR-regulated permease PerM
MALHTDEPARARGPDRKDFVGRLLIAIALIGMAVVVLKLVDLLLLLFAAVLVAILLRAISDPLARVTGLASGWSLGITVTALAGSVIGFVLVFGAGVLSQGQALASHLPAAWRMVEAKLQEHGIPASSLDWALHRLADGGNVGLIAQFAGGALGAIGELLLALVGGVYLAAQPQIYRRGLLGLMAPSAVEPVTRALDAMWRDLRHWLVGQIATMAIVGSLTGLGAFMIGLPSAAALGLIAAILEFVPYVGPVATAVPALLLALSISGRAAFLMLLVLIAVQQLEGYLLTPLIQRRAVSLPPALTLFAVIGMGILLGSLGVLLATPLTVCLCVLVRHAYLPALGRARS